MILPRPFDELSAATGFAVNPLDRLSERRDDAAVIASLREDPRARCLVVARDMPVLKRREPGPHDPFFAPAEVAALGTVRETVLLGVGEAGPVFASLLDDQAVAVTEVEANGFADPRRLSIPGRDDVVVRDLRGLATQGQHPAADIGLMGQAKSLLFWHARHRFCSVCGAPSQLAAAGWRRECTACKATHFPRTDPVVIMLAVDGDKCLLGRQPRFPKGMYSALAGFLEPGETMENAVRREIAEEAGIEIGAVTYLASQPWPFPASLMIGCRAQALTREITMDPDELEDARWFSREEARAMLEGRHPEGLMAPQPLAIAHHILKDWVMSA